MQRLMLARNAMATRFELILTGGDSARLRAAGEEAFDEIERIESQLSLYSPGSEIWQINARAAEEPVRVSPEVFALLQRAREFFESTGGTFDPTVAPLVRCWGFMQDSGSRPSDAEISAARALVDMKQIELDANESAVRFARPGMMLDLGSIGKGYALDRAVEILRDAGIENALLHGGTSTILALGIDPESGPWKIAIEDPYVQPEADNVLALVELDNKSLSVSAVRGKYFEFEGQVFGHVLDPRTGWPAGNALLGAVVLPSATATDVFSTAVLLASPPELDRLAAQFPEMCYVQCRATGDAHPPVLSRGIALRETPLRGAEPSRAF
jgi:thiamine biosynthesis lipoprotein